MIPGISSRRRFDDLTEQEILALAISSEEDDASIYRTYAQGLRADYPASAAVFDGMAVEEDGHRKRLIDLHVARFGEAVSYTHLDVYKRQTLFQPKRRSSNGSPKIPALRPSVILPRPCLLYTSRCV